MADGMFTDKRNYVAASYGTVEDQPIQVETHWTPKPMSLSPYWARAAQTFSLEHFMYAVPPIDMGCVLIDPSLRRSERCLRMPIKAFGETKFQVPEEFHWLLPVIARIMFMDAAHHESFKDYYAHLTVDTREVEAGNTQRVAGWHVDGFQSGGREPLHEIERSYLWSLDEPATEYCVQPFFIDHLRPLHHNIHSEFDKQAVVPTLQGIAGHIYQIDPYMVHRSPVLVRKMIRTTLRVTFAKTLLTDPVNTVNMGLPEMNQPVARFELRNTLSVYAGPVPYDRYGLFLVE